VRFPVSACFRRAGLRVSTHAIRHGSPCCSEDITSVRHVRGADGIMTRRTRAFLSSCKEAHDGGIDMNAVRDDLRKHRSFGEHFSTMPDRDAKSRMALRVHRIANPAARGVLLLEVALNGPSQR